MFDTSRWTGGLLIALLLGAGAAFAATPSSDDTSPDTPTTSAKAGDTVPQGFASYTTTSLDAHRHCVVGAVADEAGAHQRPFVYVEDTTANRVLWSRALALPANTQQARATHCVRNRDSLYVLQQSDHQADGQTQTRLQVVDLALASGDVQGVRDIGVPGISEAYSAWVDKGDEGMHMNGKNLVVAGEYARTASPDSPATFQATIH